MVKDLFLYKFGLNTKQVLSSVWTTIMTRKQNISEIVETTFDSSRNNCLPCLPTWLCLYSWFWHNGRGNSRRWLIVRTESKAINLLGKVFKFLPFLFFFLFYSSSKPMCEPDCILHRRKRLGRDLFGGTIIFSCTIYEQF